ncbi:MAG TPA: DUF2017 family protein [Jatrophihabitans sp.]|jgi:hypothetical protein
MKVTRQGSAVRVRLQLPEAHLLDQLLAELDGVLTPDALPPSDPVRQRLYPPAYGDDADAAAFRELTEAGLGQDRSERLEHCRAELRKARSILRTDLVLAPEAADRWIRVLNDARLTIGTRLEISEDDDGRLDAADPDVQDRARYVWLTALQDLLVTSLMGAAGDG